MNANISARMTTIQVLIAAIANPTAITIEPTYRGFRVYAYGPVFVSSAFFFTCPDAAARIATPMKATAAPIASEIHVGRASQTYAAARTKPSGTRILRATRDHVM